MKTPLLLSLLFSFSGCANAIDTAETPEEITETQTAQIVTFEIEITKHGKLVSTPKVVVASGNPFSISTEENGQSVELSFNWSLKDGVAHLDGLVRTQGTVAPITLTVALDSTQSVSLESDGYMVTLSPTSMSTEP